MKCSLSPMVPPNEAQLGLNLLVSLNVVEGRRVKEDLHQPKSRLRKLLFALQHYVRKNRLIKLYLISVLLRCFQFLYVLDITFTYIPNRRQTGDTAIKLLKFYQALAVAEARPHEGYLQSCLTLVIVSALKHSATQNFSSELGLEQVITRSKSLRSFQPFSFLLLFKIPRNC